MVLPWRWRLQQRQQQQWQQQLWRDELFFYWKLKIETKFVLRQYLNSQNRTYDLHEVFKKVYILTDQVNSDVIGRMCICNCPCNGSINPSVQSDEVIHAFNYMLGIVSTDYYADKSVLVVTSWWLPWTADNNFTATCTQKLQKRSASKSLSWICYRSSQTLKNDLRIFLNGLVSGWDRRSWNTRGIFVDLFVYSLYSSKENPGRFNTACIYAFTATATLCIITFMLLLF